jgi:DNA-binding transcriptional LysR family regulator
MQTLRHLELVRALALHKHFGKAAEALGISQPALTRSLQHLEESLGVKLFDREAGPVEPTLFGRIVLDRGETIIAGFAELKRELLLARNLDLGVLTVAAGPYPAEISVHRATGRLSAQQPLIHTSVSVKDWLEVIDDVVEGRADLGVADLFDAVDNPALEVQPIR